MVRSRSSRRPVSRGGKVVIMVALSLVGVIGVVAIATDQPSFTPPSTS